MYQTLKCPSTTAPVQEWRTYLLKLGGLDSEDVTVKIAMKSARDIIKLKEKAPALLAVTC